MGSTSSSPRPHSSAVQKEVAARGLVRPAPAIPRLARPMGELNRSSRTGLRRARAPGRTEARGSEDMADGGDGHRRGSRPTATRGGGEALGRLQGTWGGYWWWWKREWGSALLGFRRVEAVAMAANRGEEGFWSSFERLGRGLGRG